MLNQQFRRSFKCSCGGRGCLESVASGPAIKQRVITEMKRCRHTLLVKILEQKGNLEAREVSDAALAGDDAANDIFEEVRYYLAVALSSYLHIFQPTIIVLGGGVVQAGALLLEPIRRTMKQLAIPVYFTRLEDIKFSMLGTESGAIGAPSLIFFLVNIFINDKRSLYAE